MKTKRVRVTVDLFKKRATDIHAGVYDYSKVNFDKVRDPVTILCEKHGEFTQRAYSHLAGIGCPRCGDSSSGKKRKSTLESFLQVAKDKHGDAYDYSKTTYENTNAKTIIICHIHGDFLQSPKSHMGGQGCPKCKLGGRLSTAKFIEKAKKIHGDTYDYSKVVYTRINEPVEIGCAIHGDFFQVADVHVRQGSGCPACANSGVSRIETELFEWVSSQMGGVTRGNREIIKPKEIDIVVEHLKLAIEFNGLYWHSEKYHDKNYHINKRRSVEEKGYRLISIREDLWLERRPQLESILLNAFNMRQERVYARKTEIRQVPLNDAQKFMTENHVQSFRGASKHWGLYVDNEPVAVMSVTHWKNKNQWELVRYATSQNVVGGLSKLWKHAVFEHQITSAFSYVDRDLFTGSSYSNAGFRFQSDSVGFRIVKGSTTESRQKWNSPPPGLTQSEWYKKEGVARMFDSGQDKLVFP